MFVGTAGIHADGDLKGDLYVSKLDPRRFGVEATHALGKLSGRASVRSNLLRLGISVTDEELDAITARVVETGARKQHMTTVEFLDIVMSVVRALQFATFILSDLEIRGAIHVEQTEGETIVRGRITSSSQSDTFEGRGPDGFTAFRTGFQDWAARHAPVACFPEFVTMETKSAVRHERSGVIATIVWRRADGSTFTTDGFGADQTFAAIGAAVDAMNIMNAQTM
ncbi:hypothetical protein HY480_03900 [Candidatus Uhrbacteria bacterium]|nr:hypothetical protein [Candidatus Uhrbacteria bacterium]